MPPLARAMILAASVAAGSTASAAQGNGGRAAAIEKTDMGYTSTTTELEAYIQGMELHPYWKERTDFFREDNAKHKAGLNLLIGDSITEGFPVDQFYPDGSVVTRGISGDVIVGLIRRLDESVFQLKPARVFVLIGINDVHAHPDYTLNDYRNLYGYMLDRIKEGAPEAKVYVQSILPAGGAVAGKEKFVIEINAVLKDLAGRHGYEYIDLHSVFANEQGGMNLEYAPDGVHPDTKGQEAWKRILDERMKD